MTDYEKFAEYWEQAVNGMAYRISNEPVPVLTQVKVRSIWQEELLTKRFLSTGVKHGAKVFLEELEKNRPQVARVVTERLKKSEMPMGVESGNLVVSGVLGALGLAGAMVGDWKPVARAVSLTVGGAFAANAAQKTVKNTKAALLQSMEQEAARQLAAFRALLEAVD